MKNPSATCQPSTKYRMTITIAPTTAIAVYWRFR
jgi:hypothetical protein